MEEIITLLNEIISNTEDKEKIAKLKTAKAFVLASFDITKKIQLQDWDGIDIAFAQLEQKMMDINMEKFPCGGLVADIIVVDEAESLTPMCNSKPGLTESGLKIMKNTHDQWMGKTIHPIQ